MGKQITGKKRAFCEAYAQHRDVARAAAEAGYTSHQMGYRMLKRGPDGQYADPVVRSILSEFGIGEAAPEVELPAPVERVRRMAEVVKLRVVDTGPSGEIDIPTVHQLLAEIAQDRDMPGGPRVQALNILLKDLREQTIPAPPDASEVVEELRIKLGVAVGH